MKTTAVIAEYNPFHKGHAYQINKAKKDTGADRIICIMSGDYVQRGAPAITDKYTRTEMALSEGADLVIELPVCYALSSIENFAYGAVSLANLLGAVDSLCFGAEDADTDRLGEIAAYTLNEENGADKRLREYLRQGESYPAALSAALSDTGLDAKDSEILRSPNNALGIYYIRALLKLHSDISPHAVKRIVSGHNDQTPGAFSASSIRGRILSDKEALTELCSSLPEKSFSILGSSLNRNFPMEEDDFSACLFYKLHSLHTTALSETSDREQAKRKALSEYLDVNEELSVKILSAYRDAKSFSELCMKLKSKNITYTRISRCLMHILLDIKKDHAEKYLGSGPYYARILGLKKDAHDLMHELKEHSLIPLISKLADYKNVITDETGIYMLHEDIQAADLYEAVAASKFNRRFENEYTKKLISF